MKGNLPLPPPLLLNGGAGNNPYILIFPRLGTLGVQGIEDYSGRV